MTWTGALRPLAVFSLWMLASFLCHKLAKTAIEVYVTGLTSHYAQLAAGLVTLFQLFTCYATVSMTAMRGHHFLVIVTSHILATLTTNSSMALTFASSTMAIKMLEPLTSALLQMMILGTSMSLESLGGMLVVVVGSVLYVGNPLHNPDMAKSVALALVSNLALGVRNVAIKLAQNNSNGGDSSRRNHQALQPVSQVTSFLTGAAVFLCLTFYCQTRSLLPASATNFVALSLTSGVFHVTYSYVSTNVVLRYMTVVGHALANIWKRVLVVLLLHFSGRRSASQWNWLGLGLCTLGLLIYNRKKLMSSPPAPSSSTGFLSDDCEHQGKHGAKEKDDRQLTVSSATTQKHSLLGRLLVVLGITYIVCVCPETITPQLARIPQNAQLLYHDRLNNSENNGYQYHHDQQKNYQIGLSASVEEENYLKSPILKSNPRHFAMSKTDYAMNLRYGYVNWTDGKPLLSDPIPFQPEQKSMAQIREFMSRDHLIDTPFDTDGLSPFLTSTKEVITEAQRVHANLFRDLFRGIKYAVLFELASFENKGDAALSVAEVVMLEKMGIKLLFYVNFKRCRSKTKHVEHAMNIAGRYPREEVVILMHAGGNLVAKSNVDRCRQRTLSVSRGYRQVLLSQSIYMRDTKEKLLYSISVYRSQPNLTILLRDRLSLYIAQKLFNETRIVLAPDMAFQNGHVERYASPYYDVMWQKRVDHENAIFNKVPRFPRNVSVYVWDWLNMPSIQSNSSFEMAVNIMQNGLGILQKGRVLVTDRLHGHILSTLLDIPHVLLDNADQKLSAYHNTWTRGIANCRLADNEVQAAKMAMELLEEYKNTLPKRLSAVDIHENDLRLHNYGH